MADKQGSFQTFRKALRGIFRKTSEPAEEVKMEAEDAVAVQTAQPTSCTTVSNQSADEIGGVKNTDMSKVETKPDGNAGGVRSVKDGATPMTVDKEPASTNPKEVSDEKPVSSSMVGQGKGVKGAEDKQKNSDRLDKLEQQIKDFDPLSILKKEVKEIAPPVSSEFSGDINDAKLIDDLVKNVTESVNEEKGNDDISNEREATPDGDSEEDNSSPNDTCTDSNVDLKPADHANGCESDGEHVDSNGITGEVETEEKGEEKVNAKADVKTAEQVDKKQKHENASPTKTGKSKRKEDKSIDHILKALSSLQTTEEKLAALCKKYADLHEEHRGFQTTYKQGQRKLTVLSREKDQLQSEHTKAVMAKSKLEGLCRELQKHNQTVRQESLQRAREEDEKRKEISQKFQTTIGEIQQQMQDNHEKNKQLREENFELANKLKKFIEQYENREKQIEKIIQHRELEQKLADAKLEQATAILAEEKAKNQKEKELLLLHSTEYVKKLQIKEAELTMYKERYDEFQTTIKKSEEMFQKFKSEMDKMTKRCKKLEKDGIQWKQKWENANRALLEMAEEKTKYDKEKPMLLSKISKLESLCRAMQAERKARKMLESDGIDISKLTLDDDMGVDDTSREQELGMPDGSTASAMSASAPVPSPVESNDTSEGEPVCDTKSENGSCPSSASEQTDVTVIQQDSTESPPPNVSQSNETKQEPSSQSESKDSNVTTDGQSAPASEESNQSETNSQATAS